MAERRDIRNTGITNTGVYIGGDNTNSTVSVVHSGSAGGIDEAAVLRKIDTLLGDLLAGLGQLPAERAGEVATETVRFKGEIAKPSRDRDPGRLRALLSNLTAAVAVAAPLAEIVTDITDLVSKLPH